MALSGNMIKSNLGLSKFEENEEEKKEEKKAERKKRNYRNLGFLYYKYKQLKIVYW